MCYPRPMLLLIAACAALVLTACQTVPWRGFPQMGPEGLVWPAAPEPARVGFVMQFSRHQQLFTEAGGWRAVQRLFAGEIDSHMERPYALALHPTGGLLISDPGRSCVHFYCWGRQRYYRLGGEEDSALPSPVGVAALPDGRIIVSDSQLRQLRVFSAEGKPLGVLGANLKWQRPAGLVLNAPRGELYVADVAAHQIVVLSLEGALLRRLGGPGAEAGQFNFPTHLALTPEGNLAVSDSMNFRVQLLTPEGKPVRAFGSLGDKPGTFSKLKGIACDGAGRIVVVEGLFDALQFYSPAGEFLLGIGASGGGAAQFWLPAGLCYDPAEHLLFVADCYNHRVQVFRLLEGPQ